MKTLQGLYSVQRSIFYQDETCRELMSKYSIETNYQPVYLYLYEMRQTDSKNAKRENFLCDSDLRVPTNSE